MKHMRSLPTNRIAASILLSFLLLVSLACPSKPGEVRIGYVPITLDLPFFVAVDKGFFADEGLKVIPSKFVTTNPEAEALVGGRIDVITSASLEVVFTIEQTAPGQLRIFMVQANTKDRYIDYILVNKDSPIDSVQKLKGKKIGAFPGSTILTYTKIILSRLGLNPEKDVQIVQLPPSSQIDALVSGKVDAIFALEPIGTTALSKSLARSLLTGPLYYIMDPLPGGAYALSSAFTKKNPGLAKKVVRAMDKAVEFIRTHEVEAKKLLPKWTEIPGEFADKINVIPYWKLSEIDKPAVQRLADLLYENGILTKKIETERLYITQQEMR